MTALTSIAFYFGVDQPTRLPRRCSSSSSRRRERVPRAPWAARLLAAGAVLHATHV